MNTIQIHRSHASRRAFFSRVARAGTVLGTGLLAAGSANGKEHPSRGQPKPIPGGVAPLAPFGVFIHHYPPDPTLALANINEPSQITDFQGFVGATRILGGGTGTNTNTAVTTALAFRADMGFSKGEFIAADGFLYRGSFAFV